jgi:hypothetical protein
MIVLFALFCFLWLVILYYLAILILYLILKWYLRKSSSLSSISLPLFKYRDNPKRKGSCSNYANNTEDYPRPMMDIRVSNKPVYEKEQADQSYAYENDCLSDFIFSRLPCHIVTSQFKRLYHWLEYRFWRRE